MPLVVDLDGTLLRSDLLVESALGFVREHPLQAWNCFGWLARGKAALKRELALRSRIDVATLPFDPEVLGFIAQERSRGRHVVLATASDALLAQRVADHLDCFDQVLASDGQRNLSAQTKRDALVAAFGPKGFDYVGDSRKDLPVWAAARQAHLVGATRSVEHAARRVADVATAWPAPAAGWAWLHALRGHQWLKNLLLFVPLLAAHQYGQAPLLAASVLAFVCFGLCASSVYLLNDLLDLADDRHHPTKRNRAFAAGRLPLQHGLLAFPVLLVAAFGIASATLPLRFVAALGVYYVLTLAYSLRLKRLPVIDVMTLAALYTLRVIAGALALAMPLSFWLLAFSMFIFLSLAFVKRYAELHALEAGRTGARGRGYAADDMTMIATLGAASGYLSVMVLALYINDAKVLELYSRPQLIWFACPVLLTWISRVWMLAHRGQMNEDPIVFALRDRFSLALGVLMAIIFTSAR